MKIKELSYSSSANLGPGYDILSLSHRAFKDEVEIEENNTGKIRIFSDNTPEDPMKNTAGLSLIQLMKDRKIKSGIDITINKGVPVGLGLGSSGASSSAAVKAFNKMFDLNLTNDEMVYYSMYGEIAACGSAHPDNVSSGIYGGMTLITSTEPVRVRKIDIKYKPHLMLVIPDIKIEEKTKLARSMVPKNIDIKDMVRQTSRLSLMLLGFLNGERQAIRDGMNDEIVEKSRNGLFPFYGEIKSMAIDENAVSACISGAGPTILIFTDEITNKNGIISGTDEILGKYGLNYKIVETEIVEGY